MAELLRAPCIFCEYAGEGFWQTGTHTWECPWRQIGGDDARTKVLPLVMRLMFIAYRGGVR